jgi:TRAP-type C4-dicarboxylate transport system permease small subunit
MSTASQRVLQILNLLFVALLNGIVGAYSVHWINITGHFLMPTTQLPRLVAQLSIPVGSVLAVVFCFAQLVQLRNGDARTDSANEEAGNT